MNLFSYWKVTGYLLAGTLLAAATAKPAYADRVEIFVEPPAPEVLAKILYKPRYRSVNNDQVKQADTFGMMINFKFDSTEMLPESLPLLDSVGEMLTLDSARGRALIIEGHTDGKGTEFYNQGLSERRAEAIKKYLVNSFAVDPQRLITVGQGESQLYDGGNPLNPLNRRAEFKPLKNIVVQ